MKKIKIKPKKKKIKLKPKKPKLQKIKIEKKPKLKKITILGKWCDYYQGRLPFPIECSLNKEAPLQYIFKGKEKIKTKETPNCITCERFPKYNDWKSGKWDKVKEEIKKGADLRNQPSPIKNEN